jgi:hypothetical protein
VRLLHELAKIHASFDDPNLVSRAGLVPVMALAQRAGLATLAGERVAIAARCGVNPHLKAGCLVAGMIAGADSIDDMDLLRHGAMPALLGGVRAPSTLGSFLRSFTWGNVLQLQKAHREFLGELARRTPLLPGADVLAFTGVDSMQKRIYGHKKQGAAFGHTKIGGKSLLVRGLNALAATISTPLAAPVIAATRLRGGNANSARGAASLATEAVATARDTGCTGTVVVRADSAFYSAAFTGAVRRAGAFFSVTVQMNPHVRAAIAAIGQDAWTPVRYPRAIWDDQLRCWVSDAQVAEVSCTAVTSKKGQAITARLIVCRVKDLNRQAGRGQDELFPALALPRRVHRLPVRDHPGRGPPPRPCPGGTGIRRLDRRPPGSSALRVVPRERGLGCPRGHGAQPAARRRVPGQPRLRQSPRRHPAPRPHRRRRPHRPPRPRPPHPAPARGLASRARMGEPLPGGLRPARRRGLTSPDPGHRAPAAPAATRQTASQHPRQGPMDKPQKP